MLGDFFADIEKNHVFELTEKPLEIDQFEKSCGYKLPEDLKEFYRRYKTVSLFEFEGGWQYRFVPIDEIHMTGLDVFGEDYEKDKGPSIETTFSWFTVCDLMDGNYIGIDLLSEVKGQWNYIDCFHETYGISGECKVIAKTFVELLDKCLKSGESLYFLRQDFEGYGDALENR